MDPYNAYRVGPGLDLNHGFLHYIRNNQFSRREQDETMYMCHTGPGFTGLPYPMNQHPGQQLYYQQQPFIPQPAVYSGGSMQPAQSHGFPGYHNRPMWQPPAWKMFSQSQQSFSPSTWTKSGENKHKTVSDRLPLVSDIPFYVDERKPDVAKPTTVLKDKTQVSNEAHSKAAEATTKTLSSKETHSEEAKAKTKTQTFTESTQAPSEAVKKQTGKDTTQAPSEAAKTLTGKGTTQASSEAAKTLTGKGTTQAPSEAAKTLTGKGTTQAPSEAAKTLTGKGTTQAPSEAAKTLSGKGTTQASYEAAKTLTGKGTTQAPSEAAKTLTGKGTTQAPSEAAKEATWEAAVAAVPRINRDIVPTSTEQPETPAKISKDSVLSEAIKKHLNLNDLNKTRQSVQRVKPVLITNVDVELGDKNKKQIDEESTKTVTRSSVVRPTEHRTLASKLKSVSKPDNVTQAVLMKAKELTADITVLQETYTLKCAIPEPAVPPPTRATFAQKRALYMSLADLYDQFEKECQRANVDPEDVDVASYVEDFWMFIMKTATDPLSLKSSEVQEVANVILQRVCEDTQYTSVVIPFIQHILLKERAAEEDFTIPKSMFRKGLVRACSGAVTDWQSIMNMGLCCCFNLLEFISTAYKSIRIGGIHLRDLGTVLIDLLLQLAKPPAVYNFDLVQQLCCILHDHGRSLDSDDPERMKRLISAIRDVFLEPYLDPCIRHMLLAPIELQASAWTYSQAAQSYYFS